MCFLHHCIPSTQTEFGTQQVLHKYLLNKLNRPPFISGEMSVKQQPRRSWLSTQLSSERAWQESSLWSSRTKSKDQLPDYRLCCGSSDPYLETQIPEEDPTLIFLKPQAQKSPNFFPFPHSPHIKFSLFNHQTHFEASHLIPAPLPHLCPRHPPLSLTAAVAS